MFRVINTNFTEFNNNIVYPMYTLCVCFPFYWFNYGSIGLASDIV